jgi:hypothetical protein
LYVCETNFRHSTQLEGIYTKVYLIFFLSQIYVFFLTIFQNLILNNSLLNFNQRTNNTVVFKLFFLKKSDAVVALMVASSCVPGVQAHRYSGQQELASKKTAEINISAVWCVVV